VARTEKKSGLLAVLLMGLFITNVDVAIVNVAAPSIHEQLDANGRSCSLWSPAMSLPTLCC
jgi:hypothetical protein